MWEFFLRHSRFTYLLMLTLIGLGFFSVIAIPKENAPEVQVPVGIVTTVLPGAPALDVETLITNELERGLASNLDQVKNITSASREGVSVITVEFDADADIDASIQDLKDEVDALSPELPDNAEDPFVTEVDFVNQPVLTVAFAGDRTDAEFAALADALEIELESVAGVSEATASGVREKEITVLVSPEALTRSQLTIGEVINGLQAANATFPIGQIVSGDVSYNIAFEGDIDDAAEIPNIPIATRNGQPIFVRDIATVTEGLAGATTLSRLSIDGAPSVKAITFDVFKQRGGDITRVTAAVNERIEELEKDDQLLAGIKHYVVSDSGEDIGNDLGNLVTSGLQTVFLVVLVLMIAVGWREGLLAGAAIPLSFTIGFIGLYFSDNTINFISLFALILGIGVLVDAGIVMVEGINKELSDNPTISKTQAAANAVRLYASPLISGALTTVAMFVGLFVVSGVTGQFIAGIPFTLIFVLFASLFVALGFLPLLCSVFLKRGTSNFTQVQKKYNTRIESWYRGVLTTVLTSRRKKWYFISGIIGGFIVSIAFIPLGLVKVVFFEQSDVPFVFVEVELPEGTTKEQTDLVVRQVEEVLYEKTDTIEAFSVTVGSGSVFGSGGSNEKLGNIFINLRDERALSSSEFVAVLRAAMPTIPDAKITVSEPNDGPPTGSPIGVKLLGDDLAALGQAAVIVEQYLIGVPGTTNVETSNNNNNTEFVLGLDKARAAALGLSPLSVSQTVRSAVFGTEATTLTNLTDDIPVTVRLNLTTEDLPNIDTVNEATIGTIENITIPVPGGASIPLSSVVDTTLRESSNVINHEDQQRIVTVSADITDSGNVIEINQKLEEFLAQDNVLPEGVTYSFGGEAEDSNQAFMELFLALIVGIVLMVAVLVLEFNSFRYTLYVLSILPFSLIGILAGLALTGSSLSFPSIMGFIALTGIIVNNSILLIEMMNYARKQNAATPMLQVVVESSVSRLRPIILTSLTTVIGMVPLLASDPIWVPLATAIIFGLSFSVVITLVLVPIIYLKYHGRLHD